MINVCIRVSRSGAFFANSASAAASASASATYRCLEPVNLLPLLPLPASTSASASLVFMKHLFFQPDNYFDITRVALCDAFSEGDELGLNGRHIKNTFSFLFNRLYSIYPQLIFTFRLLPLRENVFFF